MTRSDLSRRAVLGGLGASAAPLALGCAQTETDAASAPDAWPFHVTQLEHMGTVVPDVRASTEFYSRLFNPAIMTEERPEPLRLYVDLTPGYLAFGSRGDPEIAFFDHFCLLIEDWDRDGVQAALESDGFAPNPAFMLVEDPDAIGVQYYSHPGGWFPTVIPAAPLVDGPPILSPHGLDHVVLTVSDLDASIAYYRRYLGARDAAEDADLVWFDLDDTRLGLRRATDGAAPGIDHISVRVAPFDLVMLAQRLTAMGARVAPVGAQGDDVLRFVDPWGLRVEVIAAE